MNFFDTGLLPVALDIIYGPLPGGPVGSALLLLLVLLLSEQPLVLPSELLLVLLQVRLWIRLLLRLHHKHYHLL